MRSPFRPTSATARHKSALVVCTLVLGGIIVGGAWYIERNPALSWRALRAQLERPLLAIRYAGIADASAQPQPEARGIPVLTYHRIVSDISDVNNVTRTHFEDQMATLKRAGWQAVSLADFEAFMRGEKSLPEKSFLLTFDDGARDTFYPVDSILREFGYSAVNFIIVRSSETPGTTYYLDPSEIRMMLATGRWAIGSHSYDGHRPYPVDAAGRTGIFFADRLWNSALGRLETPDEFRSRVRSDLAKAKSDLEEKYGSPIESFAFPLGNETGINGANNYPEGSAETESIAQSLYSFGYVQTNRQQFTQNVPRSASTTPQRLVQPFLVYRIHVDHDWDGARVLSILENGLPKSMPYEDDFSDDNGWILAWGALEMGRNNFVLSAPPESTSASAFLDGSEYWDDYSFDAAVNWNRGHLLILGDVTDSATYDACVFAPGEVRIQSTVRGETRTLAEKKDARIAYSDNARAGIRVHGDTIECTWDFTSLLGAYARASSGGIGIQTWDADLGAAQVRVSSVSVQPFERAAQ